MILFTLRAGGRETVAEYNPDAKGWGIEKEGEWDTHIFLGKVSLVHTNHWRRRPHFVTKLAATIAAAWVTVTAAHALGIAPDLGGLSVPQGMETNETDNPDRNHPQRVPWHLPPDDATA